MVTVSNAVASHSFSQPHQSETSSDSLHENDAERSCEHLFTPPGFVSLNKPKIKGGILNSSRFSINDTDTIWKKYSVSLLTFENGDSLLFNERFRLGKYWNIDQYQIMGGQAHLKGIQMAFDEQGRPFRELHCLTGEKKCHSWRLFKYHQNDSIWSCGWFTDHLKDSVHQSWYDSGQLRSDLTWDMGRLKSVNCLFDPDGKALSIGDFHNGNGTVNVYSMNGLLIEVYEFKNGRRISKKKVK